MLHWDNMREHVIASDPPGAESVAISSNICEIATPACGGLAMTMLAPAAGSQ
jgi:hypothetical protein